MSDENPSVLERLAIATRYVLVALFAAALAGGWLVAGGNRAHAAAPVAAAPNYLSCTIKNGGNSKFYVTDTNLKTICVYSLINDSVKLVSVRKFDVDNHVIDGSLKVPVALDGLSLTRDQVKNYVKACQPILDAAAKKLGQPTLGGE